MAKTTLHSTPESNSTPPKLSYSLPSPRPEPLGTLTPPLRPKASVPFQWEESPGKPINNSTHINNLDLSVTDSFRKLELPPRMAAVIALSVTMTPSSGTVIDGSKPMPLSSCYSFSLAERRTYSMKSTCKKKRHGFWSSSDKAKESNNAGKAKTNNDAGWGMKYMEGLGLAVEGYSSCLSSSTSARFSSTMKRSCGDHEGEHCKVSISRMTRNGSQATTDLWANIYRSLKQAVLWKKDSRGPQQSIPQRRNW